jgi:hypothetical protein
MSDYVRTLEETNKELLEQLEQANKYVALKPWHEYIVINYFHNIIKFWAVRPVDHTQNFNSVLMTMTSQKFIDTYWSDVPKMECVPNLHGDSQFKLQMIEVLDAYRERIIQLKRETNA